MGSSRKTFCIQRSRRVPSRSASNWKYMSAGSSVATAMNVSCMSRPMSTSGRDVSTAKPFGHTETTSCRSVAR